MSTNPKITKMTYSKNYKMKVAYLAILLSILMTFQFNSAESQAWQKQSNILSLGLGVSQYAHIDNYYYLNTNDSRSWYSPLTGQLNLQVEFGIHKYIGFGFTTGFGAGIDQSPHDYPREINMPIGLISNFHFYQLLADKAKKNIQADKLDIYTGVNLGTGLAAAYYINTTRIMPLAFGGFHAGARYYITHKVGFNVEMGWGKSIANAGVSFKL